MTRSRTGDNWCGQVVAALGQEEEESHLCSQEGGWIERRNGPKKHMEVSSKPV